MNNIEVWDLLAQDNFCVFNKSVARALNSLDAAVLLGELASEYRYFKNRHMLDEEGMFYSTVENIQENICLNAYEQRKAIQLLKEHNIIETRQKGLPAKRFIKLNSAALTDLLSARSLAL